MYIFCYSFNQNGNYITPSILTHIYEKIVETTRKPDILALGFQETRYGFEYYWGDLAIQKEYELVHKIRLNGIGNVGIRGLGLYILKRRDTKYKVEFFMENWVRFNYQYLGKGAIAISINIDGLPYLFINTHLPYHESWEGGGIKERVDSLNVIYEYIISQTAYCYLFVMGDFNFRIHLKTRNKYASSIVNDDPKLFEVYLRNRIYNLMYFNDELILLIHFYSSYLAELSGKQYGNEYGYCIDIPLVPIYRLMVDKFEFPPTYKVYRDRKDIQNPEITPLDLDRFYERWNTDRIPSWCDRILILKNPKLTRITYNSGDSPLINNSDHLPVWSLFHVEDIIHEPSPPIIQEHQNIATYNPSSPHSSPTNIFSDS